MTIKSHTGIVAVVATALALSLSVTYAGAQAAGDGQSGVATSLKAILASPHRSPQNRARDRDRHPLETLLWFGIKPDMTVVEISPGAGWYTEILAPFLKPHGKLYDAVGSGEPARRFRQRLAADPALYGKVIVTELVPPEKTRIAPAGTADMVLTFRNVHNWINGGYAEEVFKAMYQALKPGGMLGLVEHRANPALPQDPKAGSGYVREDYVIKLANAAGFQLVGRSEINANPRDTKDYPGGVWTLPPTLRLKERDREKYLAIGESDRMTLKFVKPR